MIMALRNMFLSITQLITTEGGARGYALCKRTLPATARGNSSESRSGNGVSFKLC